VIHKIDISRAVVFFMLTLLFIAGVFTAIDGNRSAYDPLQSALKFSLIWLSPLIVVAIAALVGTKGIAFSASSIALIVGGLFEYGYFSSHDVSYGMLVLFSLLANWVSAFISLFSFQGTNPNNAVNKDASR
jgi:hypothetical protein